MTVSDQTPLQPVVLIFYIAIQPQWIASNKGTSIEPTDVF